MTELPTLTRRQREILRFVTEFERRKKVTPTVREIGDHFAIQSPAGVTCHLDRLEAKGYIERLDANGCRLCRNIRVVESCLGETLWGAFEIGELAA